MTARPVLGALCLVLYAPSAWAAPAPAAKRSLYDRLGGVYAIAAVVDDFIDRLVADPLLDANPAFHRTKAWISVPGIKYRVTSFVCHAAGGPEVYSGRSMKDSHAYLQIGEAEWNAMAADMKRTLDRFHVPAPEQQELFAALGGTKAEIVVRK